MPNQRIDRNWYSRYRTHMMAVVAFIVVAVIGTTFFKGCSAIGRDSRQDVYTPSADDGFIYKANQLLSEIVEEAKKAISEDGFYGVKNTSDRILEMAKALTGGDPDKIEDMRNAFKKGFDQATKSWGQALPEISSKTYDAVMEGFDNWAKESQVS